ncbi:MAG: hypothetical protein EBW48_06175, partial [Proteobacteria bacterium]|nr:hypothetical protein [Pseudomonadota bacterium]
MLSDLFDPSLICTEANETNGHLWLSNPNQELADNIHVLESGTWTTYWHDGSNLNVSGTLTITNLGVPGDANITGGLGV